MKTKISRIVGVGVTLALLASLLVGALPAAAVTVPLLTIPTAGDNVINTVNADYNVYFNVNQQLAAGDTITVTFPAGYTVAAGITATISASPGWVGAPATWQNAIVAGTTFAGTPATRTVTATLAGADQIGETSSVRIEITAGVTNPSATGAYAVAVATSQETTAVSSNTVTLIPPVIPPLPGTVTGYNSANEILYQNVGAGTIVAALGTVGVTRVTVSPGTYAEAPAIAAGQTLISTGGAATAIITGNIALNGATSVLDGVSGTGGVTVNIGGATVRNCILSNAAGAALNVATAATAAISTGNTISAAAGQSGLVVAAGQVARSTGDTYNPAATGTGITNNGTLTLSGATVVGASGTGLTNVAGTATVTGSSFSSLDSAVNVTGGAVGLSTSTLDACGNAGTTGPNPRGAVHINGGTVNAIANTITNGPGAIGYVAAAGTGNGSSFKFNTLTGNAGAFTSVGAGVLDATNNWWGSSAGPTVASTAVLTLTSPWLIASVSNPAVVIGGTALNGGTVNTPSAANVNVAVAPGAGITVIAAANYDGNPVTTEPPADTVMSYDVYIAGGAAGDTATITFFGITSPLAQIWAYSENQDTYVLCSNQFVDMFQGAVIVTVMGATAGFTVPNIGNMTGLEFVLTEPSIAPIGAPAQASLVPAQAAENIRITMTSFTWGAVAGATGYNFELAPYLASSEDPFIPAFILVTEENLETNGVILINVDLDYSKTYAWRVQAVRGTEEGAWVTSFFTTAAEPEEVPDPIEIVIPEPTPTPEIIVEVPEWTEIQVIPDYLLWVVVAVGAILVIAVIVLIVRTRRVA
jgi:hypothetical protein